MTGQYEHERDGVVKEEEIILIVIVKQRRSEKDKGEKMLSCGSELQENEIVHD